MTFLELINLARQECGVSGSDLTSVENLSGESRRFYNWVRNGWLDIQRAEPQWKFLDLGFQFDTVAGDRDYGFGTGAGTVGIERADWKLWQKDTFRIYADTSGYTDEQILPWMEYQSFRNLYEYGSNRLNQEKPICFTIAPDSAILLGGIPDAVYRVEGRYWRAPQTLADAADEPICPVEFHQIISFRAMMRYALFESAPEVLGDARENYNRMMAQLVNNQGPDISFGEPLA